MIDSVKRLQQLFLWFPILIFIAMEESIPASYPLTKPLAYSNVILCYYGWYCVPTFVYAYIILLGSFLFLFFVDLDDLIYWREQEERKMRKREKANI
jgi:hypothetical protein